MARDTRAETRGLLRAQNKEQGAGWGPAAAARPPPRPHALPVHITKEPRRALRAAVHAAEQMQPCLPDKAQLLLGRAQPGPPASARVWLAWIPEGQAPHPPSNPAFSERPVSPTILLDSFAQE